VNRPELTDLLEALSLSNGVLTPEEQEAYRSKSNYLRLILDRYPDMDTLLEWNDTIVGTDRVTLTMSTTVSDEVISKYNDWLYSEQVRNSYLVLYVSVPLLYRGT